MPHPREHSSAHRPLAEEDANVLAERMTMLATPSRLRILYALLPGELSVEDLADAAGLPPNTVSQQLRMLRATRLVRVRRDGRHAIYALHDAHVADLLAAVRHNAEHAAHKWDEGSRARAVEDAPR